MKHIAIIGGSFSGVGTAHRILKHASKSATVPYKVTLVSRDTHFWWNIAAPRALIPGQFSTEKLFEPIAPGFKQYGEKFEFVLGSATGIDVEGKKLVVATSDGEKRIEYDNLIIGSGATTKIDGPWKSSGSTDGLKERFLDVQRRVKDAETIVIVGAGPTGVETAGELGFEYGKSKKIILVSSESL